MQVNANSICFFSNFLFKFRHHLASNTKFPIRLENSYCKNISMFLSFEVLNSSSICAYYNIVVETILGKFSILHCHFQIKWSTVFNRQRIEVNFPQDIYVFLVYVSKCHFYSALFTHSNLLAINLSIQNNYTINNINENSPTNYTRFLLVSIQNSNIKNLRCYKAS